MADLLEAAREIDGYCRRQGWRHCIIGGMALLRWGEQRMTKDVDLTLLTGFGGEERYIEALLKDFDPLVADALDFALRNRVLPVRTKAGFKADIALGGLPFEEEAVNRATDYAYADGVVLRVCSAEDLVVMSFSEVKRTSTAWRRLRCPPHARTPLTSSPWTSVRR